MYFILLLCFLFYFGRSVPLYYSTLGFSPVSCSFLTYLSQGPLVLFLLSALVFLFLWLFGTFAFLPGCFSLPVLVCLFCPNCPTQIEKLICWLLSPSCLFWSLAAGLFYSDDELWSLTSIILTTSCFPFVRLVGPSVITKSVMLPAPGCICL